MCGRDLFFWNKSVIGKSGYCGLREGEFGKTFDTVKRGKRFYLSRFGFFSNSFKDPRPDVCTIKPLFIKSANSAINTIDADDMALQKAVWQGYLRSIIKLQRIVYSFESDRGGFVPM